MREKTWLEGQNWRRRGEAPAVALGPEGAFDDMHIFAPCVARMGGRYFLWYSGSRGEVAERVFRLGLAVSEDGVSFAKIDSNPVFEFGDGRRSILTPALARRPDGTHCPVGGRLCLYYTAADLGGDGKHTLHRSGSDDGLVWDTPSPNLLDDAYAPSVMFDDGTWRLWYTDVSAEPWCLRHATSDNGLDWRIEKRKALVLDQDWEAGRLFYPSVIRRDGVYVMWYGSYWGPEKQRTALGVALSEDGVVWRKSAHNPVFKPDPARPWESHYTTSQSVLCDDDGTWRLWYGARTRPPFVHKYFAIGTATWKPQAAQA